ncbi:glutaminase, partial [Staphylococcus sp. SIMBA_130]
MMVQGSVNLNTELSKEWLQDYVDSWINFYKKQTVDGEVATYIPILAEADQHALGISIIGKNGVTIKSGDTEEKFTI